MAQRQSSLCLPLARGGGAERRVLALAPPRRQVAVAKGEAALAAMTSHATQQAQRMRQGRELRSADHCSRPRRRQAWHAAKCSQRAAGRARSRSQSRSRSRSQSRRSTPSAHLLLLALRADLMHHFKHKVMQSSAWHGGRSIIALVGSGERAWRARLPTSGHCRDKSLLLLAFGWSGRRAEERRSNERPCGKRSHSKAGKGQGLQQQSIV